MLIEDAIKQVHTISQGDADYPTSGEDDFAVILAALNNGINVWETDPGISWIELFDFETGIIEAGTYIYDLSENVKWPSGLLRVGSTPINYQKPEESNLTEAISSSASRFYISGPVTLKKLVIQPVPSAEQDGLPWVLPVYLKATQYSTGTETAPIQMSDPYFAIHFAIAQISIEDNPTLAGVHQQIANEKLASMRIANEARPIGSRDVHYDQTYAGFGT